MKPLRIASILFAAALSLPVAEAAAECGQDQAFNKMMAFNQSWMAYHRRHMTLSPQQQNAEHQKFLSGSTRMAELSAKLATKEWDAVCTGYDALAKEFGFDLKKSAEGMLTMEQLQKDGGRNGGQCDIADAAKRLMAMTGKYEDKKANGETTRAQDVQFFADIEPIGPEMNKNPSAVCAKIDELSKKYQLGK